MPWSMRSVQPSKQALSAQDVNPANTSSGVDCSRLAVLLTLDGLVERAADGRVDQIQQRVRGGDGEAQRDGRRVLVAVLLGAGREGAQLWPRRCAVQTSWGRSPVGAAGAAELGARWRCVSSHPRWGCPNPTSRGARLVAGAQCRHGFGQGQVATPSSIRRGVQPSVMPKAETVALAAGTCGLLGLMRLWRRGSRGSRWRPGLVQPNGVPVSMRAQRLATHACRSEDGWGMLGRGRPDLGQCSTFLPDDLPPIFAAGLTDFRRPSRRRRSASSGVIRASGCKVHLHPIRKAPCAQVAHNGHRSASTARPDVGVKLCRSRSGINLALCKHACVCKWPYV